MLFTNRLVEKNEINLFSDSRRSFWLRKILVFRVFCHRSWPINPVVTPLLKMTRLKYVPN